MKCMCAQTRPRFILSSERVLGGMEFEPMLTPREKSPLPENFPRGGSNPRRCGQRAQTLPTSYSGPSRPDSTWRKIHGQSGNQTQVCHFQGGCLNHSANKLERVWVCLFVGCLTSQQQASVSQGRICSDNFTCCHTKIKVVDQTFYLTQSQYTDTRPTSPSVDPISPAAWQGNHWSASF